MWGFAAGFGSLSLLFLVAYGVAYYYDYRKNPVYFKEVLSFWLIFLGGAAIIFFFFALLLDLDGIAFTLSVCWMSWVAYRLKDKPAE
ncbi:MAG: hypothetical protein JNL57_08820 [Bacteroidetes bacterium]|nr:hypothetical protein [Bacteroidota bacterium]